MGFWSVLLIAVALSMDALAVSVASGCRMRNATLRDAARPGIWFGGFQMLMPILGWVGGLAFCSFLDGVAPWIAFGLLLFVGAKMIVEALRGREATENSDAVDGYNTREMALLAIATSIDALVVGLSLSVLNIAIWWPALLIGITTFVLCTVGALIGCGIGRVIKGKAEILGGVVLVGIGIRILIQGLR